MLHCGPYLAAGEKNNDPGDDNQQSDTDRAGAQQEEFDQGEPWLQPEQQESSEQQGNFRQQQPESSEQPSSCGQ